MFHKRHSNVKGLSMKRLWPIKHVRMDGHIPPGTIDVCRLMHGRRSQPSTSVASSPLNEIKALYLLLWSSPLNVGNQACTPTTCKLRARDEIEGEWWTPKEFLNLLCIVVLTNLHVWISHMKWIKRLLHCIVIHIEPYIMWGIVVWVNLVAASSHDRHESKVSKGGGGATCKGCKAKEVGGRVAPQCASTRGRTQTTLSCILWFNA